MAIFFWLFPSRMLINCMYCVPEGLYFLFLEVFFFLGLTVYLSLPDNGKIQVSGNWYIQ